MSFKKIYLLNIIFILYCSLTIYGNSEFFNNQNIFDDKEKLEPLNSSASDVTSWNYTWGTIGEDICYSTTTQIPVKISL